MKSLKLSLLVFAITASLSFNSTTNFEIETTVYVCGKSKIYHLVKSHSALKRCKSGIKKMSVNDAKKAGKRVCKCRG